ncbi:MAG: glucose-6-phosphate isomerase, partial [Alteromonadaceae bacterium]
MTSRTLLPSWKQLQDHAHNMQACHMNTLFEKNKQRFDHFSIDLPRLLLDYSKNLINQQTLDLLMQLARDVDVEQWREKMFAGERINFTENRAVLHVALRDRSEKTLLVDGDDVNAQIRAELNVMEAFVNKVRQGSWKGYSGKRITDIVNIGVGGSNLGPQMVTEALKNYSDNSVDVHYVSNVDGTQIAETLRPLSPEKVLFVVSSKTFTTTETMTNARTAMNWLVSASFDKSAVDKHFVAVTSNSANAIKFGINKDNIFKLWDWVGGRYSLWSAIGLP